MVVAVQAELAAHVQKFAPVDDQSVTRRASAKRPERPFDLCAVRLNDGARIADVLLLCQTADERPPDLAVKGLRIYAEFVVDAREIPFGHGGGKIVEDEDLHADDGIDRILAAVRRHRREDAEIRLIVALNAVVGVNAPRPQ